MVGLLLKYTEWQAVFNKLESGYYLTTDKFQHTKERSQPKNQNRERKRDPSATAHWFGEIRSPVVNWGLQKTTRIEAVTGVRRLVEANF